MIKKLLWIAAAILAVSLAVYAQSFSSGSTGSDGALSLTTPGTVVFDPAALSINPAGDNVFNFTTITIGAGVTVQMKNVPLRGKSVIWLATGAVDIQGTIALSGDPGYVANTGTEINRINAQPGPGGYAGGTGGDPFNGPANGTGPGAGTASGGNNTGGGASHLVGSYNRLGYGNTVLLPLRGGSGGAGGQGNGGYGGGGGAGGGAIRIVSSVSINIGGSILCKGGNGGSGGTEGSPGYFGGNGSGGAIQLMAPNITGAGTLNTAAGATTSVSSPAIIAASVGRIRLDAFTQGFAGTSVPAFTVGLPYNVPLPTNPPTIRVVSIAGIPVPTNPTGTFTVPDVVMNQPGPVTVSIQASNVPLGTTATLYIYSLSDPDISVSSTALSGTLALSTATASLTFYPGYARGFVRATW